jgi:hypothetical protein
MKMGAGEMKQEKHDIVTSVTYMTSAMQYSIVFMSLIDIKKQCSSQKKKSKILSHTEIC